MLFMRIHIHACPCYVLFVPAEFQLKCKLRRFRCDSTPSRVILLSALPQIQHVGFPLDFCVSHKAAFRWFTYWCTQSGGRTLFSANLCRCSPAKKESRRWLVGIVHSQSVCFKCHCRDFPNGQSESLPLHGSRVASWGPSCVAQYFWAWVTSGWS